MQEVKRQQHVLADHPMSKEPSPQRGGFVGVPSTGNPQGVAVKWEAELHQMGRRIIGRIDSKATALQAVTLHANRMANRLEVLVEHWEQVSRKQIERQQSQANQATPADPSRRSPTSAAESASKAPPLAEVLQELADDLESIHRAIKRSTSFNLQELLDDPQQSPKESTKVPKESTKGQSERANTPQPSRRRGEMPEISFYETCREAEMLLEFGLELPEIARHLGIPLDTLEFFLQISPNVDIIP